MAVSKRNDDCVKYFKTRYANRRVSLKIKRTAINTFFSGGHFVMKMFTFFECNTICLLYLLRNVFEFVDVIKPVSSKEGNSEVYVVCREFKKNYFELGFKDLFFVSKCEFLQ